MKKIAKKFLVSYINSNDMQEKYNSANCLQTVKIKKIRIETIFIGSFKKIKQLLKLLYASFYLAYSQQPFIGMSFVSIANANNFLKKLKKKKNDIARYARLEMDISDANLLIDIIYMNYLQLLSQSKSNNLPHIEKICFEALSKSTSCLKLKVSKKFLTHSYSQLFEIAKLSSSDKFIKYKVTVQAGGSINNYCAKSNSSFCNFPPLWLWTNV